MSVAAAAPPPPPPPIPHVKKGRENQLRCGFSTSYI